MDHERGAHNQRSLDDEVQPARGARCEWEFRLDAVVSQPAAGPSASNVIGAIELDPSGRILTTGGAARRIRLYSISTLLPPNAPSPALLSHSSACDFYLCTPAKLSSLRFRPGAGSHLLAAADYDGVVAEYDLERRAVVSERDEHGGRRVWSMDYSGGGELGASGGDDGTARVWDPRCPEGGWVVHAGAAAVCCVEFDRAEGGSGLAVGSSDRRAYVYDVRFVGGGPMVVFGGHEGGVTYVRFAGGGRMVSSGTDGAHRMWEAVGGREVRAYRGHRSRRRFVGMELWREGGLIGCGSETNQVFVYDLRWGEPIWVRGFGRAESGFASAVCWRGGSGGGSGINEGCTLIAGGSDGVLQLFSGQQIDF